MRQTTSRRNRRKRENRRRLIAMGGTLAFLVFGGLCAVIGLGVGWGWGTLWERLAGWVASGSGLLWLFLIVFALMVAGAAVFWMWFKGGRGDGQRDE